LLIWCAVSSAEQELRRLLGNTFVHYVGKDEQNIQATNKTRRVNSAVRSYMTPKQKEAARKKMEALEELRKKQYLSGKYSFQRVLDITCAVYGVTEEKLLSNTRVQRFVRARKTIITILRDKKGTPWLHLGRKLGRDHSTVIHSYYSCKKDALYEEVAERVEEYSG
jgi:chromosomal replication initiation ATPase DnaA